MGWIGEMGAPKSPDSYGGARRRLATLQSPEQEARLKAEGTYGGASYKAPSAGSGSLRHQHFGPLIVSCERGDLRPMADSILVYSDTSSETRALEVPSVPRGEVIDELYGAIVQKTPPIHDGEWARGTLEICVAMLKSSEEGRDVEL